MISIYLSLTGEASFCSMETDRLTVGQSIGIC